MDLYIQIKSNLLQQLTAMNSLYIQVSTKCLLFDKTIQEESRVITAIIMNNFVFKRIILELS